jgi:prepilin-type processing-associated H-X9-DG protein
VRVKCRHAFTRTELLITLGCVVLIALLANAWRIQAVDGPRRKVCERNLKNLLAGFDGYVEANERLPAAGRLDVTNTEDWIYWQVERRLEQSSVARHMVSFESSALRCPGDGGFRYRGYPYSYSMNANFEKSSIRRIPNHQQLILLYEEEAPNDGACQVGGAADAPARRHVSRSNAGFLDGHVEQITEATGTSSKHAKH